MLFIPVMQSWILASLLQSSVSHDPSEIILIWWFGAQETFLIWKQLCHLIHIIHMTSHIYKTAYLEGKTRLSSIAKSERSINIRKTVILKDQIQYTTYWWCILHIQASRLIQNIKATHSRLAIFSINKKQRIHLVWCVHIMGSSLEYIVNLIL